MVILCAWQPHLWLYGGEKTMKLNVLAIKRLMANQQLTGVELSKRSGISRQSISTILARGSCSIINVGRLANALQVDIEAIVNL